MSDLKKKVAVGMSGGVDSSVAAALLKEQGFEVTGMMLRLWVDGETDDENRCCSPDSVTLARKVARLLDIPFYVIDARDEFRNTVVEYFLSSYRAGETPNPCVVCNKWVRWGLLKQKAELMGMEYFATGHYARVVEASNSYSLKKGKDTVKDQSYVLSRLNQSNLSRTLLPLGEWEKFTTRRKAESLALPVSQRKDSQDLCFTAQGLSGFLQRQTPELFENGEILDLSGKRIGEHSGLANFTIGQRKGIRIAREQPLYVVGKDLDKNQLIVSISQDRGKRTFSIRDTNWILPLVEKEFQGEVMVRYRSKCYSARVRVNCLNETAEIETNEPIPNIAPGQLAVIYHGEDVIGSGFITAESKGY
jgi:tRNA-specific 2-thiouridylase